MITPHKRVALAQEDLLGFVVELKAQTNNKIKPTIGIKATNMVHIHSPIFTGGYNFSALFCL
jgi:hypothetical protein